MTTDTEQIEKPTFPWLDAMSVSEIVGRFVALRAARKKADDEHDAYVREHYLNEMEAIEQRLINHLAETGANSIASDYGTAYRYDAKSVTVSDQREFKFHVIRNEAWHLIEWRANKTAVLEIIEDGQETPPGVKTSSYPKIGFRSPTK